MRYELEELLPLVQKLLELYTSFDSSSVTYEKANELMGAVLYCIQEAFQPDRPFAIATERTSAKEAYDAGFALVTKKVEDALSLYNRLLPEFNAFQNKCLHHTFVKELPEFFRRYDARFAPQDTILTLDYPVLCDLSGLEGIDRIYRFLTCIRLEQLFLRRLPDDYVIAALSACDTHYKDASDNLCAIVFSSLLYHALLQKPLSDPAYTREDALRLRTLLCSFRQEEQMQMLRTEARLLLRHYGSQQEALFCYLQDTIQKIPSFRMPENVV